MSEQLPLVGVAPPLPRDAATTPGLAPTAPHAHQAGREPIPAKPSKTARLRGACPECGQWPLVGETTGKLMGHKYHKSDFKGRRGRCAGAGKYPAKMKWSEPFR